MTPGLREAQTSLQQTQSNARGGDKSTPNKIRMFLRSYILSTP